MDKYPRAAVRRVLDDALAAHRRTALKTRRTRQRAAAERLVDAIAVLIESGDVDAADLVAFEDARAAVEKYRKE